ncbi:hypothetical protein H310_09832 [Aphanomyces invadans]|uniref:Uncharacterized protein n=1 Tax=Aphanomyces invadans TaxID=157072 RepID=A0A024TSM1_9STRA|nr:hypothetical protein H310_09832 [Aphanomyces invadans]ETV96984.1 hypothetical protein H310_09832 [Aphanomyces invadans]|eukprot:XP_008874230.1 hypothetical protein H310_09832 [Aphanomyces invadans]
MNEEMQAMAEMNSRIEEEDRLEGDFSHSNPKIVDFNKHHFRTFSLLIQHATDLMDKSILNEVDNIYKPKLLPIIKSRGYN